MTKFRANNGREIETIGESIYIWSGLGRDDTRNMISGFDHLSDLDVEALREFFLHEAGIWVDPVTGAHVYRSPKRDDEDGRCILSIPHEGDPHYDWEERGYSRRTELVERYFAAHPAPKPWHDAKPGEVWQLTTKGVDDRWNPTAFTVQQPNGIGHLAFVPTEPDFSVSLLGVKAPAVIAGRRIWPEVVTDA